MENGCLRLGEPFVTCPAESIDYAVMEKTSKAAVVPLDAGWSDVGSWAALRRTQPQDAAGNVFHGNVVASGVKHSFIHASSKQVAVAGLDNVVIVETDDAILLIECKAVSETARFMLESAIRGQNATTKVLPRLEI